VTIQSNLHLFSDTHTRRGGQENEGQLYDAISSYLLAAALFGDVQGELSKEAQVQRLAAINNAANLQCEVNR
jgi:hypothetical protein